MGLRGDTGFPGLKGVPGQPGQRGLSPPGEPGDQGNSNFFSFSTKIKCFLQRKESQDSKALRSTFFNHLF